MDAKSGTIFCKECDDFVYDARVTNSCTLTSLAVEEKCTAFQGTALGFSTESYIFSCGDSGQEKQGTFQTVDTFHDGDRRPRWCCVVGLSR